MFYLEVCSTADLKIILNKPWTVDKKLGEKHAVSYIPSTKADTQEACSKCVSNVGFIKNRYIYLGLKENETK